MHSVDNQSVSVPCNFLKLSHDDPDAVLETSSTTRPHYRTIFSRRVSALTQLRDLDPTLVLIIIFIAETIFQGIAPPRPAAAFSFIFLSQDVQCTNSKIHPATRRSCDDNVSHLLQKIDDWKQCLLMLVTILLILCHNYQLQ